MVMLALVTTQNDALLIHNKKKYGFLLGVSFFFFTFLIPKLGSWNTATANFQLIWKLLLGSSHVAKPDSKIQSF